MSSCRAALILFFFATLALCSFCFIALLFFSACKMAAESNLFCSCECTNCKLCIRFSQEAQFWDRCNDNVFSQCENSRNIILKPFGWKYSNNFKLIKYQKCSSLIVRPLESLYPNQTKRKRWKSFFLEE